MSISDAFAAELQQEAIATRKVLERIPDDRLSWKPHEKSWSFIELASHVASLLEWSQMTLDAEEFALSDDYKPWRGSSSQDLVQRFDSNVAKTVDRLQGYPDSEMMKMWSLKRGQEVLFSLPRVAVMRSFVFNHLVHHRAQLSVYLRLNDIPVPPMYGPTADES